MLGIIKATIITSLVHSSHKHLLVTLTRKMKGASNFITFFCGLFLRGILELESLNHKLVFCNRKLVLK